MDFCYYSKIYCNLAVLQIGSEKALNYQRRVSITLTVTSLFIIHQNTLHVLVRYDTNKNPPLKTYLSLTKEFEWGNIEVLYRPFRKQYPVGNHFPSIYAYWQLTNF